MWLVCRSAEMAGTGGQMAKKRAPQFKTSILSTFEALPGAAVARAAARKRSERGIPVLVRPDRGKPVLLVRGRNGKMRAYDIRPKKGKLPRAYFDTAALIRNPHYQLVPIASRVLSVRGLKLTVEDGQLTNRIPQPLILISHWGEIGGPKSPAPPPPPPTGTTTDG